MCARHLKDADVVRLVDRDGRDCTINSAVDAADAPLFDPPQNEFRCLVLVRPSALRHGGQTRDGPARRVGPARQVDDVEEIVRDGRRVVFEKRNRHRDVRGDEVQPVRLRTPCDAVPPRHRRRHFQEVRRRVDLARIGVRHFDGDCRVFRIRPRDGVVNVHHPVPRIPLPRRDVRDRGGKGRGKHHQSNCNEHYALIDNHSKVSSLKSMHVLLLPRPN